MRGVRVHVFASFWDMKRLTSMTLALLAGCGAHYNVGSQGQPLAPAGWCQTAADCPAGDYCAQGEWLCPAAPQCGTNGPCSPYCGACVAAPSTSSVDSGSPGQEEDGGSCPALINCNSFGVCYCADGPIGTCPTNSCANVCCGHGGVADAGDANSPPPGYCATSSNCDAGMYCAQGEWLCPVAPNCAPDGMCSPYCGVCVQ
jgi:hypothetical protein